MIDSFRDEHRWLSNFWPCTIKYKGRVYNSVEAAYQARKEPKNADAFVGLSAHDSKKLGKTAKLRKNWDKKKVKIMWELLQIKFARPSLKQKLLDTGEQKLVEGNWWNDTFWGVCNGVGLNMLGKMLMDVRSKLRGE